MRKVNAVFNYLENSLRVIGWKTDEGRPKGSKPSYSTILLWKKA
jgi:hypothetical protein